MKLAVRTPAKTHAYYFFYTGDQNSILNDNPIYYETN